jgi:hypothetical protein
MSGKRRMGNRQELSLIARSILQDVRSDFTSRGLGANTLQEQYVGVPIASLWTKYCESGEVTQVDFDLALKELEEGEFVRTGPLAPFDNEPGSGVFIIGVFSKREYLCLTEAGYRTAAQVGNPKPRVAPPHVHISGGTFHQSPIGIGGQVTQIQEINVENDVELIGHLTQLYLSAGLRLDEASKAEMARLVHLTRQGDIKEVKPIFQRLFGLASEGVRQTAWGLLAAMIAKAVGM